MKNHSTRASSDDESNASRTQRQAIGGTPQPRRGVERDNLRNDQGESMVVRLSEETPCNESEISPVHHSDCNECGTSVADSLLE